MAQFGELIRQVTPCVLVSPDSVARFFPAEAGLFDIVVFDESGIAEGATFEKPIGAARGIDAVLVNGEPVWAEGKATGARPGQVLRRG